MILFVFVFALNYVFTWVIPIACAFACVASENQALPRILYSIVNSECGRKDECDTSQL